MTAAPDDEQSRYRDGQRSISIAEPELGLGAVRSVSPRTVTLWFPAASETRQYAVNSQAPLRRAIFRIGDAIATAAGRNAVVCEVRNDEGLLSYDCGDGWIKESELSGTLSFSNPLTRLFAGQFDRSATFDLRRAALTHQSERRRSPTRGFVGGRIDLLAHQLGIAGEVTGRLAPRVLLADEVGLGKTIEACLIVHRLLLTGRAARVLVIVPDTLVHQWFLELLRRFNLWFHIFTEARCAAIEDARPGANPFLDDQLVLCDLHLFTDNPARVSQAVAAGWDMVVVDEAHHLTWSPTVVSPEYSAIERLGQVSPGLLLLTATPEQLGVTGHFARLRLLDPDRFANLDAFIAETAGYTAVADLARPLHDGGLLSDAARTALAHRLGETRAQIDEALALNPEAARTKWLGRLLDQHGTGRVMFRNTRATVAGFPPRVAMLHPLQAGGAARRRALADEWTWDVDLSRDLSARQTFTHDVRIDWVLGLLQTLAPAKVLLICSSQQKTIAIESALRHRTQTLMAAFHEGMTLVQRDRGAAWFADPDGARLLICSEIGSEGRNFQFAHHLVLFDLPLDPGLLEQRLGRLDRIGQRGTIHVHVPVVHESHLEVLARWYGDGLDAFVHQVPGARELLERFEPALRDLASRAATDWTSVAVELDRVIDAVRDARHAVALRLEHGRDRLLEWNSSRPALASTLVGDIGRQDDDRTLDEFMLRVFDLYFIEVEELMPRTWRLGSAGVLVDDFPGLKAEGLTMTRDRQRALVREDLQFLTWDHPLATGALDLLLGSEKGNCGFARWIDDSGPTTLYLEAVYVLECLAPASLHADRFLPPTPLRIVVDHRGRDIGDIAVPSGDDSSSSRTGQSLLTRADLRDTLLPKMIDRTRTLADARCPDIVQEARARVRSQHEREITCLRELQKANGTVREEEIALLVAQQTALDDAIAHARPRLDAVRLIHRGPRR